MILDSYFLRALAIAGYAPSFSHCARCGVVGPHQAFSPASGGAVCERCRPAGSARPSPATFELLGALLEGRWEATRERSGGCGEGGQRADLGVPGLAPGPRPALAGPRRALSRDVADELPATRALVPAGHVPTPALRLRHRRPAGGAPGRRPRRSDRDRRAALPRRRAAATEHGGGAADCGAGRGQRRRRPVLPRLRQQRLRRHEYTVAVDFDPGTEQLTGRTVVAAQATEGSAASISTWRSPTRRVRVDDVDAAFVLEGFQDLKDHPGPADRRRRRASR